MNSIAKEELIFGKIIPVKHENRNKLPIHIYYFTISKFCNYAKKIQIFEDIYVTN